MDYANNRMVFQVTHGADEVLAKLRARMEPSDQSMVAVETVRWSTKELQTFRGQIESMPNLGLTGIYEDGSNGLVEVWVAGDAEEARRRIAEVVDPCAFKVEGNHPPLEG